MGAARHILVVEEDDVLGENLCEYLRRSGHVVWLARTAPDAVSALGRFAAEFVLLDLDMLTGAERVIDEVMRRGYCAQRLVLMTSNSGEWPALRSDGTVMAPTLRKPFSLQSLGEAFGRLQTAGGPWASGKAG